MYDTYFTYSKSKPRAKMSFMVLFFSQKGWLSSMDIALSGSGFAHHNKKSRGQKCYHMVITPG